MGGCRVGLDDLVEGAVWRRERRGDRRLLFHCRECDSEHIRDDRFQADYHVANGRWRWRCSPRY